MGFVFYTVGPVSSTEAPLDKQAQRCVGKNNLSYICESGHCCEDQQCCNHFFELWWFWLMCAIIFILTCCCVCRYRRLKHRLEQQQRQHEINLIAYREARSYTSTPFYFRFLPSYFLPDYEDETNYPLPPPPPYSNLNSETSACTDGDPEEVQCLSRQTTSVPTELTALCSSPNTVGLETSRENQHRDDGTDPESMLTQDRKDQEINVETPEEQNIMLMERQRHFTGDSGIEVCMCSQETESHRSVCSVKFCDSCGARADKDTKQGTEIDASQPTPPQLHTLCLCLHTIAEQEGSQECQT